ncbi:AAA family ATPase [Rhodococcus qingshengii]|uniref:AAA family ATPase n=1 Tax=Rhodococcus qingshengii TaxID=334542 RepID=UPI001C8CDD98|nr:AAA family ATPase [Rhodococcus qingshengii]MBX9148240.1 AAA family ATPase [Rhodococcus qingshengii]
MTGPAFDRVRDAFVAAGLAWKDTGPGVAVAQAPGHSARDLSFGVRGIGGQVVVHSYANEDTSVVLNAVGLGVRDLFDSPKGVRYDYPDGRTVQRSVDKRFRQSGNTKPAGLASLYRADRLEPGVDLVYVVEGEKDVHALESIGAVAVCSPMGAGKADRCDLSPLKGRAIVIVQDKDDPGRKHAEQVAGLLAGQVASLKVAEARVGKDAADHVAAGFGLDDLVQVRAVGAGRALDVVWYRDVKHVPVKWLWCNWIPYGYVTLLAGREKIGKSTLAVWIAAQASNGGLGGESVNVLYVSTEDSPALTIKPRIQAAMGDDSRIAYLQVTYDGEDSTGTLSLPRDLDLFEGLVTREQFELVVFDAATSVMGAEIDGYSDRAVRSCWEAVSRSAQRHGYSVLGLVHFGKASSDDAGRLILGSIAWSQVARSIIAAAQRPDRSLIVSVDRSNLTATLPSAIVKFESWVDPDCPDAPIGRVASLDDTTTERASDYLGGDGEAPEEATGAELWLSDYLEAMGETPSKAVKIAAEKAGYPDRTIKRAAKRLGVVYGYQSGEPKGWDRQSPPPRVSTWSLPPHRVIGRSDV